MSFYTKILLYSIWLLYLDPLHYRTPRQTWWMDFERLPLLGLLVVGVLRVMQDVVHRQTSHSTATKPLTRLCQVQAKGDDDDGGGVTGVINFAVHDQEWGFGVAVRVM